MAEIKSSCNELKFIKNFGAPGEIQTPDHLVRMQRAACSLLILKIISADKTSPLRVLDNAGICTAKLYKTHRMVLG